MSSAQRGAPPPIQLTPRVAFEIPDPPYTGSAKQPDTAFLPVNAQFPSVVVEVAYGESLPRLRNEMALWIQGTGGATRVVILLKYHVRGVDCIAARLEVWRAGHPGDVGPVPVLSSTDVRINDTVRPFERS